MGRLTGHEARDRADGGRWRVGAAAAVVAWLALWQMASLLMADPLLLPGPSDVLASLARLIPTTAFRLSVLSSAARIIGGTLAGYAVAFALALAAFSSRAARTFLEPPLAAVKGTPLACIVVLLLIWFGPRHVCAAAVFLVVVPGIYFPVLEGLDRRDPLERELFHAFGAHRSVRALASAWPAILPHLLAASRSILGMSWKAGVAAELIGVPAQSIGERIYQSKLLLETADLFAWTIVVVAAAWLLERVALAAMAASWPRTARAAARRSPGAARRPRGAADLSGLGLGEVADGEVVCVVGPSGSGKTTLLRELAGLPGHLDRHGPQAPLAPIRTSGVVFQETVLVDELDPLDNVLLLAGADAAARAGAILRELLPEEALDRPVGRLSGGQRRRVELARALALKEGPLILDEPFTGLDPDARSRARDAIARHQGGRAVCIATHDVEDARALGARIVRL
ncbi:MAG: ATP-binding cassette domain-containing protein [Collinsella sp.]|nr:ATP-binding cassette domain-containing protein [Collinsella sp.]